MDSPNCGKPLLEQAFNVARALMAYYPAACDVNVALWEATRELDKKGCLPYDKWFKVLSDECERYIWISSSGAGESSATLPEGAVLSKTIDLRGRKPVTCAFERFVEQYDNGEPLAGFVSYDCSSTTKDEGSILPRDPEIIKKLRACLSACEKSHGEQEIGKFREALKNMVDYVTFRDTAVPMVTPSNLVDFSRYLASLHSTYGADARLFGSVAAASQICVEVAKEATAEDGRERRALFTKLATYLTVGQEKNPVRILSGVTQQCIEDGFARYIFDIANSYKEKVKKNIVAAKALSNLDEYLEAIYGLIPYAHGAHIIFTRLAENRSALGENEYRKARGAEREVDEILVRLTGPFWHQVLDFDGKVWRYYQDKLNVIKVTQGAGEAAKAVDELVNRHMIYPKACADRLIEL